jgi:protein involved in polysaccharide export with SLBB domain
MKSFHRFPLAAPLAALLVILNVSGLCGPQAVRRACAETAGARDPAAKITVTVSGAVAAPGSRTVSSGARLGDVLPLASPSLDADLSAVEITHAAPGNAAPAETIDYLAFLNDKQPAGNPLLRDGDRIEVPHKQSATIEVSVRGQVTQPGRMTLPAKSTFVDAIRAAKGLTSQADQKSVFIEHAGDLAQIPVNYDAAFQDPANAAANPVLNDGDIIIVRSVALPSVYTIGGAVLHPGEYPLPDQPITLADAIGKAGGPADHAKLNDTTIVRALPGGKVKVLKLKAGDPAVQGATIILAGDNVTIPQGAPAQRMDPLQVIGLAISLVAIFAHR